MCKNLNTDKVIIFKVKLYVQKQKTKNVNFLMVFDFQESLQ